MDRLSILKVQRIINVIAKMIRFPSIIVKDYDRVTIGVKNGLLIRNADGLPPKPAVCDMKITVQIE